MTAARGPKTAKGRARSACNARRYSFTCGVEETEADTGRIEQLTEALLGGRTSDPALWSAAVDAARAHHTLDLIRGHRIQLLQAAENAQTIFAGPGRTGDRAVIRGSLKKAAAGRDIQSESLRELNYRERRQPPRDRDRRHAELLTKMAPDLEKLDRYESRALSSRKKAFRALALAIQDSVGSSWAALKSARV